MAANQVLESKTVQVRNDPEEIDRAVQRYGLFFWEFRGTQITDTKNTTWFVQQGETTEERDIGPAVLRNTDSALYRPYILVEAVYGISVR